MNKFKLITVLGTRPEIIRLSLIIKECDEYFDNVLVHTGQNYDKKLYDIFFDEMNIRRPDHYLGVVGKDLGETMGNVLSYSYRLFKELKPDALLILGDTNSSLCAISAKRLKIPIFHMEAGNRCFDQNVPEEINRKIVDHISDINLPYTENSRRYLLAEGFDGGRIFVTGSPLTQVLHYYKPSLIKSNILTELNLTVKQFIIISIHREENIDIKKNFNCVIKSLDSIASTYKLPMILTTHPRTKKRFEQSGVVLDPLIRCCEPFGFFDYGKLQMSALCVVSDSGSLSEEASILGFNAVSFRTSTERPEALDKGSVVVSGINPPDVLNSIRIAIELGNGVVHSDYVDLNVSTKIIKIIQSYIPIINKRVWDK